VKLANTLAAVAQEAGTMLLKMSQRDLSTHYKSAGQLVTNADSASHDIIRRKLQALYPNIPCIMEEQANPEQLPPNYLVVDELDGTAIYANGMDDWGVMIASVKNNEPVAGVIYQPAKDKTLIVERGFGSWLNKRRVVLDANQSITDGVVALEINRFQSDEDRSWACRLACESLAIRSLSTAAGNAMELLSGNTLLYLNTRGGKVWDFAAAALAVQEAGGVATDCSGEALVWDRLPMGVLFAVNSGVAETAMGLK